MRLLLIPLQIAVLVILVALLLAVPPEPTKSVELGIFVAGPGPIRNDFVGGIQCLAPEQRPALALSSC
jgi:hypothetical protein